MAEMQRKRSKVVFEKEIVTDNPNAYARAMLEFEGLRDERTTELQQIFNAFYAEVEKIVEKETGLVEEKADPEKTESAKKVMRYKNGRPYFDYE